MYCVFVFVWDGIGDRLANGRRRVGVCVDCITAIYWTNWQTNVSLCACVTDRQTDREKRERATRTRRGG